MDVESYLLGKKASGGGGGTSDYSQLSNKPSINGVTLDGDKTSADLGINAGDNTFVLEKNEYYDLSEMKAGIYGFNDVIGNVYVRVNSNYLKINFGSMPSYFAYLILFRDNVKETDLSYMAPLGAYYVNNNNGSIKRVGLFYKDSVQSGINIGSSSDIYIETNETIKRYSGYDNSKTQTLKNVNGTLTWLDD